MAFEGMMQGAGSTPSQGDAGVGSQPQPQQSPSQGSVSQGTGSQESTWSMPETLRGKSSDDLARMYTELEKKLGQQGTELGTLRQYAQKAQEWIGNWEPIARAAGYRPERVAEAMMRVQQGTDTAADRQVVKRTEAQAQKQWAEALTAQDQEQWIQHAINQAVEQRAQQLSQQLYDGMSAVTDYQNRYGDFALRAIEQKMTNPALRDVPLNQILQDAVQFVSNPPDPIAYAAAMRQLPNALQAIQQQAQQQARAAWDQEQKNKSLTTFVGAGSMPRPYRSGSTPPTAPTSPAPQSQNRAAEPTALTAQWESAKESAAQRLAQLLGGGG